MGVRYEKVVESTSNKCQPLPVEGIPSRDQAWRFVYTQRFSQMVPYLVVLAMSMFVVPNLKTVIEIQLQLLNSILSFLCLNHF